MDPRTDEQRLIMEARIAAAKNNLEFLERVSGCLDAEERAARERARECRESLYAARREYQALLAERSASMQIG